MWSANTNSQNEAGRHKWCPRRVSQTFSIKNFHGKWNKAKTASKCVLTKKLKCHALYSPARRRVKCFPLYDPSTEKVSDICGMSLLLSPLDELANAQRCNIWSANASRYRRRNKEESVVESSDTSKKRRQNTKKTSRNAFTGVPKGFSHAVVFWKKQWITLIHAVRRWHWTLRECNVLMWCCGERRWRCGEIISKA